MRLKDVDTREPGRGMTSATVETQRYLERVGGLEPVLREHMDANERDRQLVEPVVDALREAGMFRLGVPRHYGGAQLDPLDSCRIVAALAEIDSAVAWNVAIAAGSANFVGMFGTPVTDAVFGDSPDTVTATATSAPAFVTPIEDGFEVNGELRFLSGAHQADWFMSLAIQLRDGVMVTDASGEQPLLHLVCVEREAVSVLDRWHVSAMRGTGSTDVAIGGARIPASQLVALEHLRPGGHFADREFQLAPWNAIHMEAAVSIGIARAALHDLKQLATTKIAGGPDMKLIQERERVQHNLGLGTALVDGAQAYMTSTMSTAREYVERTEGALSTELKVGLQLSAFTAADAAARAVDLVCEAAGTSSARLECRFERYFRDVHFLTKHASKSVERVTSVGRMLLGMPPGWPALEI